MIESRNPVFTNPRHIASVYRAWAADGMLLYVGHTTKSVRERMIEHARDPKSEWYPFMTRLTSEEFPDLGPAKRAEDHAIATENPRYNRAGRPRSDWVPRGEYVVTPPPPPEVDKADAHGSLLRLLLERHPTRDVHDAAVTGHAWIADHNGYRAARPPRLYLSRGVLRDWVMADLGTSPLDTITAVDRLALTERRVRQVGPSARRMRWLEIDASEFSADEWQMVIDVLPPRPPVRPDIVHDESSGRSGRRADDTYEGESF